MRILLTGATGYIGSRLVTELLEAGHEVVVTSRNPERVAAYGWFGDVAVVQMDARESDSTAAAFESAGQVDLVYYLLHGIGDPGFRESDNRAAGNVAEAARAAGVRRLVYLGGFVPGGETSSDYETSDYETLSDHLAGRAEVAEALSVAGGAEVVWLGAALIIGAGSTSFEILRYAGDRFPVLPVPSWMSNPIDPISIRDVLYYLVAAADAAQVPAGSYDISGPETTSYRYLLGSYARLAGNWQLEVPVGAVPTAVVSRVSAVVFPVPGGLTSDLTASLDYPMTACGTGLRALVPEPEGGLLGVDEAMIRSLTEHPLRPVNKLADPHHLADTDPDWAGGDTLRLRQLASVVTPTVGWPILGLIGFVPRPVAAAVRTGLDTIIGLVPR
ncbi:MAG: NAD(P)H-binding protein [Microbacteriaceae bacterium]